MPHRWRPALLPLVTALLAFSAFSVHAAIGDGLWVRQGEPTAQARALIELLCSAESYGLRSVDYLDCPTLAGLARATAGGTDTSGEPGAASRNLDQSLSVALRRFLQHVHYGRVTPREAGFDLDFNRAPLNYEMLLLQLSSATDVRTVIAEIEPPFEHYRLLKSALAHYRALADGRTEPTAAELRSAPFAQRIRQIELTLERWRWLPQFRTPPIIVNIPQFRLFAFQSTRDLKAEILQMDVIVGRTFPSLRTPVFAADMRYVVFRPYWDVPYSITRKELLPQLRRNPDTAEKQHLELLAGPGDDARIVPFSQESLAQLAAGKLRLRQRPGADNPLGLIKFVLPNSHNVYLHSTPASSLFKRSRRTFSHGCIRVSDPVALAEHVLRNSGEVWTAESITAAMNGTATRRVNLREPIHVLILYATVLATEDGGVQFFEDIYGFDRRLAETLAGAQRSSGQ